MAAKTAFRDGPASPFFAPLEFRGNVAFSALQCRKVSSALAAAAVRAPAADCVSWGLPFRIARPLLVSEKSVTVRTSAVKARWLVFMHLSDSRPVNDDNGEPLRPPTGEGRLGEHAADYVIIYCDGSEVRAAVRRRREIGVFGANWGESPLEARNYAKPHSVRAHVTQQEPDWGRNQTRVLGGGPGPWVNSVWAWENPHPRKSIAALRFEPVLGTIVVSGVSVGNAAQNPLRWEPRRKAILTLPKGEAFDAALRARGELCQIDIDMGQIIHAAPRLLYPARDWRRTCNNCVPETSDREILVEYAAHPDARFHLPGGRTVAVARLQSAGKAGVLQAVSPQSERVQLQVVEKSSRRPVAVKLHVHGEAGEYIAPVDRHRVINPGWFEDYAPDFTHLGLHHCTYIPGRATIDLPVGRVFIEVSKGFEIRPVRKTVRVRRGMKSLRVEVEKVLPWREKGWVSADTHVHFLSPHTALLEGAGEGVNVVNLLASQWGELVTNVGDFDGRTTLGSRETGGDGEYLVRVGTENRQFVLGHISLLGYDGGIIAPMTTGGPEESAIGDPVGCLLTEWARQCKAQNGVVVIPHFPRPRAEHAATIVSGQADAVEMTSWGSLYNGINPYSLLDWYRYLNCGYLVAAVGGTDKMSASTAVGTIRTYARVGEGGEFTYAAWKDAIRRAETFVTYGPLLEFAVEGRPAGSRIPMTRSGGTVDVAWRAASVTLPMTRMELVVNGEVRESRALDAHQDEGSWSVPLDRSSWITLLVRGRYRDRPEIIAAHTSPVMVDVTGTPFFSAADAMTILEQIEGALAFIDTVGTRAETMRYRQMRMTLTSAHRSLHNRMHREGCFHRHAPAEDHGRHRP